MNHVKLTALLFILFAFVMTTTVFAYNGEGVSHSIKQSSDRLDPSTATEGLVFGLGEDKIWQVKPRFQFRTVFDSNVNREASGEDEDVIFNINPGIALERKGSKLRVKADYDLNYQVYVDDSDQNAFNHVFGTEVEYTGDKLNVLLSNDLGFVKTYASSESSERTSFDYDNLDLEVKYDITDKVSLAPIYRMNWLEYNESILKANSYFIHEFGGRAYYDITDKTDVYIEGSGHFVDYYESGIYDSQGYKIVVGAIGKVTDKTTLSVETGFKGREYDDDSINEYNNWVFQGIIKYYVSSKVNLELSGKRDIAESVFGDTGFYSFTRGNLGVNYNATEKINANAYVGVQGNDYSKAVGTESKRDDYVVDTGLRFSWTPYRYTSLSTGYAFSTRQSNINTYEYIDHMVDASVTVTL